MTPGRGIVHPDRLRPPSLIVLPALGDVPRWRQEGNRIVLVIWKADFEGNDKQLARVNELLEQSAKEVGGKIDGPYYPQDASLMYLLWAKQYEDMNRSGRKFLAAVQKEKLPITPLRYEVAVTPEEFWGK